MEDGLAEHWWAERRGDVAGSGWGTPHRGLLETVPLPFADPVRAAPQALPQALEAPLELSGGFRELHPSPPLPIGFLFTLGGKFPRSGLHLPARRRPLFSVGPTPSRSWNPQVSLVEKGCVERRGGGKRFRGRFRSVCLLVMAWGLLRGQKPGVTCMSPGTRAEAAQSRTSANIC